MESQYQIRQIFFYATSLLEIELAQVDYDRLEIGCGYGDYGLFSTVEHDFLK